MGTSASKATLTLVQTDSPALAETVKEPNRPRGGKKIGSAVWCSFSMRVDLLDSHTGEARTTSVPCGRRICNYCGERKAEADSRRFARAFAEHGGQVYVEIFPTRKKATEAVKYSSKLGHAALAVPVEGGEVFLFTTQPRRKAQPVDDLQELLDLTLSQVPAYTAETKDQAVLVVPNKVLAEHVIDPDQFRRMEADEIMHRDRQKPPDGGDHRPEGRGSAVTAFYVNDAIDTVLDSFGLVLERDGNGRIIRYRIPSYEADPAAAEVFWAVFEENYTPVDPTMRLRSA